MAEGEMIIKLDAKLSRLVRHVADDLGMEPEAYARRVLLQAFDRADAERVGQPARPAPDAG